VASNARVTQIATREQLDHVKYFHQDMMKLYLAQKMNLIADVDVQNPSKERVATGKRVCLTGCASGKLKVTESGKRANDAAKTFAPRVPYSHLQADLKIWTLNSHCGRHITCGHACLATGDFMVDRLNKKSDWLAVSNAVLMKAKNVLAHHRVLGETHMFYPPRYHTDVDLAIVNKAAQDLFDRSGTAHTIPPSYNKCYNRNVEVGWRVHVSDQKTLMADFGGPASMYMEALDFSVYWRRRLPKSTNPGLQSAFQLLTGKVPSYKHCHRWGCLAMAHVPKENRGTNDPKSIVGWYFGLSEKTKAMKIWMDMYLPRVVFRWVTSAMIAENVTYGTRQQFTIAGYNSSAIPRSITDEHVDLADEPDQHLIEQVDTAGEPDDDQCLDGIARPTAAEAADHKLATDNAVYDATTRIEGGEPPDRGAADVSCPPNSPLVELKKQLAMLHDSPPRVGEGDKVNEWQQAAQEVEEELQAMERPTRATRQPPTRFVAEPAKGGATRQEGNFAGTGELDDDPTVMTLETMVTGLEVVTLEHLDLDSNAMVDEIDPDEKEGVPLLQRIGARGAGGAALSDAPSPTRTSTMPLGMEAHNLLLKFETPRFRHEIARLPVEVQQVYYEAEATEVHNQEHVLKLVERVNIKDLPPGTVVYNPMMAYKIKPASSKYKYGAIRARGCVKGMKMKELLTACQKYASTVSICSLRLMVSVAGRMRLKIRKFDAENAFGSTFREVPFHMHLYPGFEQPRQWRLLHSSQRLMHRRRLTRLIRSRSSLRRRSRMNLSIESGLASSNF
jgi:hypothetical protein